MSRFNLRAAALAAALLPALAPAAPLTLDQALDLAVQRSQATRSARAGAQSAAELARASGQQPDPMLTVGIDNLPVTGRDRFRTGAEEMTMKRIGFAQEWVSPEKRAAREAAAQSVATRESLMERVAAAETRVNTALAFVDAYYAGQVLRITSLAEKQAREELEAAKGRLTTTSGSGAEVLALTASLGLTDDESADVRQQQGTALAALQRWVGVTGEELVAPSSAAVPTEAEYVAAHPAVVARQRDIDIARREVEAARLNRKPNWTWEVSYGQRAGYADMLSFGVRIPLTVAPEARQDRETAAKLAMVDKAEAELTEAQRAASGEHAALANDLRRLQERIGRLGSSVIAPAQQRTAAALASYRSNLATLAMVFEARRAEVEAQRRLLALQRDRMRTQVQLMFKPVVDGGAR